MSTIQSTRAVTTSTDPLAGLKPKDRLFIEEYIKSSNATKAYMVAHPKASYATANAEGWRVIKRFEDVMKTVYEVAGLGTDAIIKTLKDALKANRDMKIIKKDGSIIDMTGPDHYARMKSTELIHRYSGYETDTEKGKPTTQVNVQIISDEKKGIFRVQDAQ